MSLLEAGIVILRRLGGPGKARLLLWWVEVLLRNALPSSAFFRSGMSEEGDSGRWMALKLRRRLCSQARMERLLAVPIVIYC